MPPPEQYPTSFQPKTIASPADSLVSSEDTQLLCSDILSGPQLLFQRSVLSPTFTQFRLSRILNVNCYGNINFRKTVGDASRLVSSPAVDEVVAERPRHVLGRMACYEVRGVQFQAFETRRKSRKVDAWPLALFGLL